YAGGAHGGNAFGIKIVRQTSASLSFYHFDHLGSVTAVSDENGHVVTTGGAPTVASYDPWGARRSPDGRPADPAAFQPLPGHREFTSHETIPSVGLVNMNGRVYDPALGRFLSPDPNVQFVADLQSYNRYSYVLNNPLRTTDPTGYYGLSEHQFNATQFAFGTLVGIVASAACGYGAPACAAAYLVVVAYTATTMYMAGLSQNQIIAASAIGIAAGFAGGLAGGVVAAEMGGGVGAAMVSGAVSSVTSMTITSAVMGRSLGSDEFLLGFISGAVLAGVTAGMNSNLISEAYAAKTQGDGGSGSAKLESRVVKWVIASSSSGGETVESIIRGAGYGNGSGISDDDLLNAYRAPPHMSRADAAARYGANDGVVWAGRHRWIVLYQVPAEVLADPAYQAVNSLGNRATSFWTNSEMVPMLDQAFRNLQDRGLLDELHTLNGSFEMRAERGAVSVSAHAWGIALDVNAAENPRFQPPAMSSAFVRAFTDPGFTWGGTFQHPGPDPMHFSFGF
ncbi:MAG TPA: RHS repeat-associated core domain-containing protein, partial [Polyangia bacterium]|nr:RHS repeat-associated core domain-containing protein [Polyangia bacterium]